MLDRILSDDRPRSRLLNGLLIATLVALAVFPFFFRGATSLNVAAMICIFILLAASYDMLLGYTNVISFAHASFFGVGMYATALMLKHAGSSGWALAAGLVAGMAVAVVLAFVVGLLSLRVKALFFALVTLAVAAGFSSMLLTQYHLTGGEDGLLFRAPEAFRVTTRYLEAPLPAFNLPGWIGSWFGEGSSAPAEWAFSVGVTGKLASYYLILALAVGGFLLMLRFMNSPFGRVLQAIRENEFRVRAIGYKPVIYRTAVFCLSSAIAAFAGGLYALWAGYASPEPAGFAMMMNILIVVVVGGIGTLYGAVLGAVLLVAAENYLRALVESVFGNGLDLTLPLIGNVLGELLHPNRWLMWMGLIYVLSVYFFSRGIVGQLRARAARAATASPAPSAGAPLAS